MKPTFIRAARFQLFIDWL